MIRLRQSSHQKSMFRRGNVLVISAAVFAMIFGFTAFVVDIGYITNTRGELAATADAAALAATIEFPDGYTTGMSSTTIASNAKSAAVAVAASNRAGDVQSVYCNPTRDIRLGSYTWDATTSGWVTTWGATPYNIAEVTLHRDQAGSTSGDQPLNLFFAPAIGRTKANVSVKGQAALLPITGVKKIPGRNLGVLPITLDQPTWDAMIAGGGADNYSYNPETNTITAGSDGVREVDLYPLSKATTTAGNRGTVDFGATSNSTADIARQILYGLNDADMNALNGQMNWVNNMQVNGDTGISAGIKDELATIKGDPRLIPLFTSVSGPGNTSMYTLSKFVGIRILNVQLTGKTKSVVVQPASFVEPAGVTGETTIGTGTVFGPANIVK